MRTLADIRKTVRDHWRSRKKRALAELLLDKLSKQGKKAEMLTFASLRRMSKTDAPERDFIEIVMYLAAPEADVLEMEFLFYDTESDHEYEIGRKEVFRSQLQHYLIHPSTGEKLTEFEQHLYPYFVPTKRFLRAVQR